jgi:hypothetical protein
MISASMSLLLQLYKSKDSAVRSRLVWKMTPAALVKVCMIPTGSGRFLGEEINAKKERPQLWGSPIETFGPERIHECRFALVDPRSRVIEWHQLEDLLGERAGLDERNPAPCGPEQLQALMNEFIDQRSQSMDTASQ